ALLLHPDLRLLRFFLVLGSGELLLERAQRFLELDIDIGKRLELLVGDLLRDARVRAGCRRPGGRRRRLLRLRERAIPQNGGGDQRTSASSHQKLLVIRERKWPFMQASCQQVGKRGRKGTRVPPPFSSSRARVGGVLRRRRRRRGVAVAVDDAHVRR